MLRKLAAQSLYSHARWALGFGRPGMAHAYRLLRLTCALWPDHPEACYWLSYLRGRVALEQGRPEEALELLRAADRALPEVAAIKANLGLAYTMTGQDERAVSVFERLLKEDPAVAREEVWFALAWSYLRTGRAPKAREVCHRAYEVGVRSPRIELIHRLATGVGLGSLAVNEIRDLVQSVPHSLSLLLEYARRQARDGRHRLARATISAFPEDEEAHAYSILARASLNEDDPKTAHWAADQIERTHDEQFATEALLIRAEVAIRREDLAEAIAQARRALEREPDSGRAHEQLGKALLLQGKWEAAVTQMTEALHRGGGGALAAGVVGLADVEAGDLGAARGRFGDERYGDGLACLISHTAQARLLAAAEEMGPALERVARAVEELEALPTWAQQPELLAKLHATLGEVVRKAQASPDVALQESASTLATRL